LPALPELAAEPVINLGLDPNNSVSPETRSTRKLSRPFKTPNMRFAVRDAAKDFGKT
jgi:hypothetical protein